MPENISVNMDRGAEPSSQTSRDKRLKGWIYLGNGRVWTNSLAPPGSRNSQGDSTMNRLASFFLGPAKTHPVPGLLQTGEHKWPRLTLALAMRLATMADLAESECNIRQSPTGSRPLETRLSLWEEPWQPRGPSVNLTLSGHSSRPPTPKATRWSNTRGKGVGGRVYPRSTRWG